MDVTNSESSSDWLSKFFFYLSKSYKIEEAIENADNGIYFDGNVRKYKIYGNKSSTISFASDYSYRNSEQLDIKTKKVKYNKYSDIYDEIKKIDDSFSYDDYVSEKTITDDGIFYTFFRKINGGKTLNGFVAKIKNGELTVSKSENNLFDIHEENILFKDRYSSIKEFIDSSKGLSLIKSELIYQDGILYYAHSIQSELDGLKEIYTIYEEK